MSFEVEDPTLGTLTILSSKLIFKKSHKSEITTSEFINKSSNFIVRTLSSFLNLSALFIVEFQIFEIVIG